MVDVCALCACVCADCADSFVAPCTPGVGKLCIATLGTKTLSDMTFMVTAGLSDPAMYTFTSRTSGTMQVRQAVGQAPGRRAVGLWGCRAAGLWG
jgi:hypothetical protein